MMQVTLCGVIGDGFLHRNVDVRWINMWLYNAHMKPLPAPNVPGKTESERFDNALRQVLSVSKEELLKREAQAKHRPEVKRPKK